MAALRALLLVVALVGFFLVGAPLQWLVARWLPRGAHLIPILFCRTLLAVLRVRVSVTGARQMDGPVLIAANHVSWIDILALGGLLPFCFLAKSDVAGWPIISAFAGVQGTVFVDRKRRRSIPQANRDMARRMAEGRTVLLFPEATTIAGPPLGRFHSSHFDATREFLRLTPRAGTVAVQPVAIAYSSPDAAWVGDDDLVSHLWLTLRAAPLTCRIAFGIPIACTIATDRKSATRASREAIIAMLDAQAAAPLPQTAMANAPASCSTASTTPGL